MSDRLRNYFMDLLREANNCGLKAPVAIEVADDAEVSRWIYSMTDGLQMTEGLEGPFKFFGVEIRTTRPTRLEQILAVSSDEARALRATNEIGLGEAQKRIRRRKALDYLSEPRSVDELRAILFEIVEVLL